MVSTKEQYQDAATTLAYAICRDAVWSDRCCNWIGSSIEDHYGMPKSYARALGTNFYDGTAGIAFFLTALLQLKKDFVIEKTAHGALQQIIDNELTGKKEENLLYGKLGFYTGWVGSAYVLEYAGVVFGRADYTSAAQQLLQKCMQLPQQYWGLDIIDGAAGAIPALAIFYRKQPNEQLKRFIIALGDYLLEKADKENGTISWNTMPGKTHNLTGYGHGAAGFACAFAELYNLTGEEKYIEIVRKIVKYENGHFVEDQQNWPDFRNPDVNYMQLESVEVVCGTAWCHGAPGIGLSRLRLYQVTRDTFFKRDVDIALQTTIKAASIHMLSNYSLCHGLFGNAELLLSAAEVFEQPQYLQTAEKLADDCIRLFLQKKLPIPNGLQTLSDTPDFMLGTSGIGYFFLRLSNPEKFPCMLLITK